MKPTVNNFIKFDPKIGVDSLHIIGYPRSGKSVHANSITIRCVRNGEMGLMPGDRFCEWRHLDNYDIPIKLLIPEKAIEIVDLDLLPEYWQRRLEPIDPLSFDILDYLEPKTMTVIYDRCYTRADRGKLWVKVLTDCVQRIRNHDKPIVFLDHEAGANYPEIRTGKLWKVVEDLAEIFVDFPKSYIRCIFLSQLEKELCNKIRNKCIWKIFRKSVPSKHSVGAATRKYSRRMRRDTYHIFYGNSYVPLNSNPKIKEKNEIYKIIPRDLIKLNGGGISETFTNNFKADFSVKYGKPFFTPRDSSGKFQGNIPIEGLDS